MIENRSYLRFALSDRFEHWVLTLSFTTLAITGLVQKYASGSLAQWVIDLLGGIEGTRLIHRYAAILLMLEVVYHLGMVGYRLFVRRVRLTMLPGMQDVQTVIQALLYNVGLRQERPQQGRYTFEEKAEYWAVVWGTLIMVITGFMLWNPIAAARFVPGEFIPAAKAAHGGEALLATLAIIIWHLYGVHVKVFNKSMFSGHLTEEEMLEEHPLELAQIRASVAERPVDAQVLDRRRRTFWGVYGIVAVVMLAGIYWFVSFEETAITTMPPAEDVLVFAPLTPTPLPTPLPTSTPLPTLPPEAKITWNDGVADLFESRCAACHNSAAKLGGLDLSSYQTALAGGNSGPVIEPEDLDASLLVTLQAAGAHPGQFSADELELVRQWIAAGAMEE
jgi:formate dehydrogenase gamma subunit